MFEQHPLWCRQLQYSALHQVFQVVCWLIRILLHHLVHSYDDGQLQKSTTASARMEPLQTIGSTINHMTATYGVLFGKNKLKEHTVNNDALFDYCPNSK